MDLGGKLPNARTEGTPAANAGTGLDAHGSWHQEMFYFAPDAQLVTDGHGVIREANHAASLLFRCSKEFLLGKPLALFTVEGQRQHFYAIIGQLNRGLATHAFKTRFSRRDEPPREAYVMGWSSEDGSGGRLLHWLARDITELSHSEAARAELQRRLATAQEDERRRVARDLHDTTGQLLTALSLGVRAVQDAGPLPPAAQERLDRVRQLTDDLARQVHELATGLRPTALDDLGLEAAVRQLVANWSAHTGVEADFQASGLSHSRFPPEIETALFRVVQESLTNVAKHAGARRVSVVLGSSNDYAVAVIEDDGIGFDVEGVSQTPRLGRAPGETGRLGLLGMRERAILSGGTLEVESTPGQGTTIIARIPFLNPAAQ